MTQPTSNILPFPIPQSLSVMKVSAAHKRVAEVTAVASVGEHPISAEDYAAHAVSIFRTSIHFARRKSVRLDSLPPQLRTWLLDLRDQGNPTCRVVLNWLTGTRRLCAPLSGENA